MVRESRRLPSAARATISSAGPEIADALCRQRSASAGLPDLAHAVYPPEGQVLAARNEPSSGTFPRRRRRKHEDDVGRRLFEGFQKGIKRCVSEHMRFVDNIDFIPAAGRDILYPFSEVADIIHAVIRRAVYFHDIHGRAVGYRGAERTGSAGDGRRSFLAVEGFREYARGRGFSDPLGPEKRYPCAIFFCSREFFRIRTMGS